MKHFFSVFMSCVLLLNSCVSNSPSNRTEPVSTQPEYVTLKRPSTFGYVANCYTEDCFKKLLGSLQHFNGVIIPPTLKYFPQQLEVLQKANPELKMCLYTAAENLMKMGVWEDFWKGVDPSWIVKDTKGNEITFWSPDQPIPNYTQFCPENAKGETWNEYFVRVLDEKWLQAMPQVNCIFLDYFWNFPYGQFGTKGPDFNIDGLADNPVDLEIWSTQGSQQIVDLLRKRLGERYLIISNTDFATGLNGVYLESFPQGMGIEGGLEYMQKVNANAAKPVLSAVHFDNPSAKPEVAYQAVVTSLLINGTAASETFGPTNQGQARRFPFYNLDLGNPLTPSFAADQRDNFTVKENFDDGAFQEFELLEGGVGTIHPRPGLIDSTGLGFLLKSGTFRWKGMVKPNAPYKLRFSYTFLTPGGLIQEVSNGPSDYLIGPRIFAKEPKSETRELKFFGDHNRSWKVSWTVTPGTEVIIDDIEIYEDGAILTRQYEKALVFYNTSADSKVLKLDGRAWYRMNGQKVEYIVDSHVVPYPSLSLKPGEYDIFFLSPPNLIPENETIADLGTPDPYKGADCGAPLIQSGQVITWSKDGCFRINQNILNSQDDEVCSLGDHNGWAWQSCIHAKGPDGDVFTSDGKGGLYLYKPGFCQGARFTASQSNGRWASYQSGPGIGCENTGCFFKIDCTQVSP